MPEDASFPYRCIAVLGATAGIGRDLAIRLKQLPSQPTVIATGRRLDRLQQLAQEHDICSRSLDQGEDAPTLKGWTEELIKDFPQLDCVIFCASVQSRVDPSQGEIDYSAFLYEMHINFTSQVALATYLTPHFKTMAKSTPVMMGFCTSNLAYHPSINNPWYCPSKSAMHSYLLCFRQKLRPSKVKVVEIIIALVESELHDSQGPELMARFKALWMPLSKFGPLLVQGLHTDDEELWLGLSEQSKHLTHGEVKDLVKQERWI